MKINQIDNNFDRKFTSIFDQLKTAFDKQALFLTCVSTYLLGYV